MREPSLTVAAPHPVNALAATTVHQHHGSAVAADPGDQRLHEGLSLHHGAVIGADTRTSDKEPALGGQFHGGVLILRRSGNNHALRRARRSRRRLRLHPRRDDPQHVGVVALEHHEVAVATHAALGKAQRLDPGAALAQPFDGRRIGQSLH